MTHRLAMRQRREWHEDRYLAREALWWFVWYARMTERIYRKHPSHLTAAAMAGPRARVALLQRDLGIDRPLLTTTTRVLAEVRDAR